MSGVFQFFGRPRVEPLMPHELRARRLLGDWWELMQDYTCVCPLHGTLRVPAGLEFDWATVPAITKAFIDDNDRTMLVPTLFHDWLYSIGGVLPGGRRLSREQVDDLLRRMMVAMGAGPVTVWLVYRAVRLFGGSRWKEPQ